MLRLLIANVYMIFSLSLLSCTAPQSQSVAITRISFPEQVKKGVPVTITAYFNNNCEWSNFKQIAIVDEAKRTINIDVITSGFHQEQCPAIEKETSTSTDIFLHNAGQYKFIRAFPTGHLEEIIQVME